MPNLKPLTKQRWVVTVNGGATSIVFDKLTGAGAEWSQTDYNDGVTGQTKTALGFLKNANVTLSKTADEETDAALRDWLKTQLSNGNQPFDMSYQAVSVNKAGDPIGSYSPITVTQCTIARVKYPEVERTSSDLAMWEVEVVCNGDIV